MRKRSKRVADGVIAIPGTFVNGLVRANPKRDHGREARKTVVTERIGAPAGR